MPGLNGTPCRIEIDRWQDPRVASCILALLVLFATCAIQLRGKHVRISRKQLPSHYTRSKVRH